MRTSKATRSHYKTLSYFKRALKKHKPALAEHYKVKSLGIFGSYVRNQQKRNSDLDVLVEFEDDSISLLKFVALENSLSDLLGVKVDLVMKAGLKPHIGQFILREVVPI